MTRGPSKLDRLPQVQMQSRAEWRTWLESHHASSEGVWLVTFKKATGLPRLSYDEIVEELLCFGWVDSLPRTLDAKRSMLLCTPRKPKSGWSKLNKERVAKLERAGLIQAAGERAIQQAKENGAWERLDEASALIVPDDLNDAFAEFPAAQANFLAFPPGVRRGILEWIAGAKKPETRAKRIHETASLANENVRANQWPRRK